MAEAQGPRPDFHEAARALMGQARSATLATVVDGAPFVALVTPAFLPDGSALLLLSTLSAHTRHLQVNPACALLIMGEATSENPQTAPRLSLSGKAAPIEAALARNAFLAAHPYAALYADFTDFGYWRVELTAAHYVGGFAAASGLDVARLAAGT
jgi:putative heme iron utilization protein